MGERLYILAVVPLDSGSPSARTDASSATNPKTFDEIRAELSELARKRTGSIPVGMLVEHVLAHAGDDFDVRVAAIQAVLRRVASAERDELRVVRGPKHGVLGSYTTSSRSTEASSKRRKEPRVRPYETVLEALDPYSGACDCADYLRSSLGFCKHLAAVLSHVYARRQRHAARTPGSTNVRSRARLEWNFVLPLVGELDRLAGLCIDLHDAKASSSPALRRTVRWMQNPSDFPHRCKDPKLRLRLLRGLDGLIAGTKPELHASPSAKAIVREELERSERWARCRLGVDQVDGHLARLRRRLYSYQREGVMSFLVNGRLLLADDMGLGKTTQAIAAAHVLFEARRITRGLIIVPASLKTQWEREWHDTTDVPISIVDGSAQERANQYHALRSGFLILNYEQLIRDFEHVVATGPDMVVLDEAQRIKNWATKSATFAKALDAEYRLVLTGTPMENRLDELASVLDWVDDLALAPKWRLSAWHMFSDGNGGKGRSGARNLETIRARLAPCMLRRVRKEVLAQLPARTDTRVPVEMTREQLVEHWELDPPIRKLLAVARRRPLTQMEFLKLMTLFAEQRMISNGLGQVRFDSIWPVYRDARPNETLLDGLFSPKLLELRRLVEELVLRQGRKAVVFSQWRNMLRLTEWSVRDLLGDAGLSTVFFTGAESQQLRRKSVIRFHDDPDVRMMFLSDAGGVGLNLQRAATVCINLELPWNPAVLEQRIGRIYRLGQKQPIDVFNLVSATGIEARIAGLVSSKRALFDGLFDGTSNEVLFGEGQSFLSNIEKLVDAPELPPVVARISDALADDPDARGEDPVDRMEADSNLAARTASTANGQHASENGSQVVATSVEALMRTLSVVRSENGSIRIDVPASSAESLVAMFQSMAKLVQAGMEKSEEGVC